MHSIVRFALGSALLALLAGCAATGPEAPETAAGTDDPDVARRQEGSLIFESIPPIPEAVTDRMRQYRSVRRASLHGWLPNGDALITTRFGETRQVHRVSRPGGARQQLTFFDEPVSGVEASPNRARPGFMYVRDEGGSERYQAFFFDLTTGRSVRLSDGESRNHSAIFGPYGRRVAYSSTRRNGRDTDVWVGGLDPDGFRIATEQSGSWYPVEFSPDGHRLLVYHYVSRSRAHPWVVDLDTGEMTSVLPEGLAARVDDVAFGPEGRAVYLTSDLGGEFVRLYRVARPGAEPTPVTGDIDWNVERFELSTDGRYLAWTVNERTRSRLYVRDLIQGTFVAGPELPEGVIYGLEFGPDNERLGFTLNGATSPGDVHAIDLKGRSLTRWTRSEVGGLDPTRFVAPEHFRFPAFDTPSGEPAAEGDPRRQIPAFIYRPRVRGSELLRTRPVIISIHGGPESQARPYFSSTIQYWVNELGAAVIRPNVRGSTGYGRSFHRLDNAFGREDSVRDIGALLDWIERQPDLDPSRVVVQGGSYGGYMVLAALTLYPERIAAGVETVGISSFVTFLENTRDYRRDLRRAEYGDERDPEMRAYLERISPLNRTERIQAPLLVIQGANDPRVPASESEQIVRAVREQGTEVWYLLALDEGHGFSKRGNSDAAAAVTAMFLERQLYDQDAEQAGP